jgi:hypothetical protein
VTDEQTLAYVQAAAVAVALPLSDTQAQRVANHLQRTASLAALLDGFDMAPNEEPAEIYCPAPFQPSQY